MANTLNDLANDIYTAVDVVGREQTGYIASVSRNADTVRAAKGDTVRAGFTQVSSSVDVAESLNLPNVADIQVDNKTMTISKSKAVQIAFTGEETKHLDNGVGYSTVYGDLIAQAMRKLSNEIEYDLYVEAAKNASLAFGTGGTNAFATDFDKVVDARQALVNAGCPLDDLNMVLSSAAAAAARKQDLVTKADVAGSDTMVRNGILLPFYGINIRETGQTNLVTTGADQAGAINMAGNAAVGTTALVVDGYTAALNAGQVITFAGDTTNSYVVNSATTTAINLAGGLKVQADDDDVITADPAASYSHNVVFHRKAVELALRAPALPSGGDSADDAITVQDPFSGLVFEVRTYRGYRKNMIEVAAAWGVKAWKPDFITSVLHTS